MKTIFKTHESIKYSAPYLPDTPIIVEAGAFNGSDTIRLAEKWPNGHIHAFEPVPELFKEMQKRVANHKNISCYEYALSDHDGTAQLYLSEKPSKPGKVSQGNSLLPPKERLHHSSLTFDRTITVPTLSLDSWAHKFKIPHVDLLWLDMQGHELAVLQASHQIIKTVQVIFTEVSFIESYENQPQVNDMIAWMNAHGFEEKGRDFSNTTDWFFGNMLFVKKEKK